MATDFFEIAPFWNPRIQSIEKTSSGVIAVGTTGRALAKDLYGRVLENRYEITRYEPYSTFAYEATSRFAEDQPDGPLPPMDRQAVTPFSLTIDFKAVAGGTLLTVAGEADLKVGMYHKLAWPWWTATFKEETRNNIYRLRDYLEHQAGLPARPIPRRIRTAWVIWGVYLLVFLLFFWLHSARVELGLSVDIVNLLRGAMSGMVVVAFLALVIAGIYQNSARTASKRGESQKDQQQR